VEHSKRLAERPQNGRAPLPETRATPGQSDGFILLTLQEHRQQSALREGGSHFSHGILFLFGDCNARVMIGSPQLFRSSCWVAPRQLLFTNHVMLESTCPSRSAETIKTSIIECCARLALVERPV
jgi:hypothetical protein